MPDESFDAVIIGGGNKGLFLALYLIKYGGMKVGIFERRHEIGGCLCTEELSAPGFRGNDHANTMYPWYYLPAFRDFPQLWDYGIQWDQHLCSDGFVFLNNETALAIYSDKHDPTQERTAREIARFSQRDAEKWLKLWKFEQCDAFQRVQMDSLFMPPEWQRREEAVMRQMDLYTKIIEAGFEPTEDILSGTTLNATTKWWESQELQSCILRWCVSAVNDINEPGCGAQALGLAASLPTLGFNRGGTHQVAHAVHQTLVQMGCKFFTHADVKKAIIENGTATGIQLRDGSQIKANKLVVSAGLSPEQLCFEIIGEEYIKDELANKVRNLERSFGCIMWYIFAVHEAPKYKAEAFNPDIHECMWLGLQPDPDPMHISRECQHAKALEFPPLEDYCPTVCCHSLVDPSMAPPGKHVIQNEQLSPPASHYTEKEWGEIKKRYLNDMMKIWGKYASNMTFDNLIGVDTNSPYDNLRMRNLAPNGTMAGIDRIPSQIGAKRPTPELANYRTPVKNLYATGGCWCQGSNASCAEAYSAYKIIATDLGLGKPWEEQGKEEPESLIQQLWIVRNKVRAMARPNYSYR